LKTTFNWNDAMSLSPIGTYTWTAFLLFGCIATSAHAEVPVTADEDIEVIEVSSERERARVAGSAYVVDEEQLEQHNYNDIHQVLAPIPGVYIRTEDGFGLRPNIGMRGASSDRSAKIMLLEDGIPMAPAPYAAPAAYFFPLVTRMTAVEVYKGATAIKYGPQTIGGAINFVSRAIPEAPTGAVDLGYGSYGTMKAHAYGGAGTERWGFLAEAAHLSSDGFKTLDSGGETGFFRQDFMVKTRLGDPESFVTANAVELKLGFVREVSHEGYLGLTQSDFEEDPYRRYAASEGDRMAWERKSAALTWRLHDSDVFKLRTTLYHHDFSRVWEKFNGFDSGIDVHDLMLNPTGGQAATYLAILKGEEDSVSPDQILMRGTNDRRYINTGLQSTLNWYLDTKLAQHDIEFGVRLHRDAVLRLHTEDGYNMISGEMVSTGEDAEITLNSDSETLSGATYLQDDIDFGPIRVLPGIRFETYRSATGDQETGPVDPVLHQIALPGLGLFLPTARWLDLLAGVHRGFSPSPPGSSADLVPETAWNYELGGRFHGGGLGADLIGFFSDFDNITAECTLSSGCDDAELDQQFNGGHAWVYGLEHATTYDIGFTDATTLRLMNSYTYTHAEFRSDFTSTFGQYGEVRIGDTLPYVPTHQGALGMTLLHDRGSLSLFAMGRSSMRDTAGSTVDGEPDIPATYTIDSSVSLNLGAHLDLLVSVTNLTNHATIESWRPGGARSGAPRQITGGLKGIF
jgi:Fe(3+) dicitrate transport protein